MQGLSEHDAQQRCESKERERKRENGRLWAEAMAANGVIRLGDKIWRPSILPAFCLPGHPSPLTDHSEVDLGLPAAQLVLHQQGITAAVLLVGGQDGELAAALTVLHLDVLALLDLRAESGQVLET